jgi:hypothetical protein
MQEHKIQHKQRVESHLKSPKVVYLEGAMGSGVNKAFNLISKTLYRRGWSIVRLFDYKEVDVRKLSENYLAEQMRRIPTKVYSNTLFLGGPAYIITRLFWYQSLHYTDNSRYPCLNRCIKDIYHKLSGITVMVDPKDVQEYFLAARRASTWTKEASSSRYLKVFNRYEELAEIIGHKMPNTYVVSNTSPMNFTPIIYRIIASHWSRDELQ